MKWYKRIEHWVGGLFSDEKGSPSSKRFVGIMCGVTLCVTLFTNVKPADNLVDVVAMLAFGCLGLSSIDKIFTKKDKEETLE